MLEGIRYRSKGNKVYLIPEVHFISVWSTIIDDPKAGRNLKSRIEEIYSLRKKAIESIDPDVLLIEYPEKKQEIADSFNGQEISATKLIQNLSKIPKGKYEMEKEYQAYEEKISKIREKESEIFKGRKIYCYDWNKSGKETAKRLDLLTAKANGIVKKDQTFILGIKDLRGAKEQLKSYIRDYEKNEELRKKREKTMAKNIKKLAVKTSGKRIAALCGANHYIELYHALGAKATKETSSLYDACLKFDNSEQTRKKAYERATRLVKTL